MSRLFRIFRARYAQSAAQELSGCASSVDRLSSAVAALKWPALRIAHQIFREQAHEPGARRLRELLQRTRSGTAARLPHSRRCAGDSKRFGGNGQRNGGEPNSDALRRLQVEDAGEVGFHQFVQWVADRQLHACCDTGQSARAAGRPLYRSRGRRRCRLAPTPGSSRTRCCRACRSARRPTQYNPAGQDWGLTDLQSARSWCAQDFAPLREHAARGHASCRRDPHRSCARSDAAVRHPARLEAARWRLHPLSVRPPCSASIAEESRQVAMHRDRRGPRHGAGGFPRNDARVGPVVLSGDAVRARSATASFSAPQRYPRKRARHVRHPRPADLLAAG